MTPYERGFSDGEKGYSFSHNPFDWYDYHDEWAAWCRGWLEYRRNN